MVRKGDYGTYKGKEYHLACESDPYKIYIFTHDKSKVDETFEQCNRPNERECYKKYIELYQLEDAYQVFTDAIGKEGKRMYIELESVDQYYVFVGEEDKDLIENYSLTEEDRGIYGGWINKEGLELAERRKHISY